MKVLGALVSLLRCGVSGFDGPARDLTRARLRPGSAVLHRQLGSTSARDDDGYLSKYAGKPSSPATQFMSSNLLDEIDLPANAINWYPGHIAKAEKELTEYLKKVDVVVEIRDARIPLATSHPLVPMWVGKNKPLIVCINRIDQVSTSALRDWKTYYSHYPPYYNHSSSSVDDAVLHEDSKVFFVNGKTGQGMHGLRKQILKAGISINTRRKKRGILPRAVRAMVIGYPNVGKSALINRLLHRKLAKSYNKPGVTRMMQWVRLGDRNGAEDPEDTIELLDSPGIIPAKQVAQLDAVKLAICNDIGEASYDRIAVAMAMVDLLRRLHKNHPSYVDAESFNTRLNIGLHDAIGDEVLHHISETKCQDNTISGADKLLSEFRKGLIGKNSLEGPPVDIRALQRRQAIYDENDDHVENVDDDFIEPKEDADDNNYGDAHEPEVKNESGSQRKRKDSLFNIDVEVGAGKYDGW
jgi:ribosome biogenesis GTPase A